MRREEIRLGEVQVHAAIERRPSHVDAGFAGAAEEVDVVILHVGARLPDLARRLGPVRASPLLGDVLFSPGRLD